MTPDTLNSELLTVRAEIVTSDLPLFERTTVSDCCCPTTTLPKATIPGETLSCWQRALPQRKTRVISTRRLILEMFRKEREALLDWGSRMTSSVSLFVQPEKISVGHAAIGQSAI